MRTSVGPVVGVPLVLLRWCKLYRRVQGLHLIVRQAAKQLANATIHRTEETLAYLRYGHHLHLDVEVWALIDTDTGFAFLGDIKGRRISAV